jgi:HAMP domain-containing protein
MNQMSPNPLADLKDIHLPPQPGWWPPAPGWWLVTILLLAIIVFILIKWRRHQARLRPIKLALKELNGINLNLEDPAQRQLRLQEISALIRRFSLLFFSPDEVAELCGQEWLDFICQHCRSLDNTKARKAFAPLIQSPYAPTSNTDLIELKKHLEIWFKDQKSSKKPKVNSDE